MFSTLQHFFSRDTKNVYPDTFSRLMCSGGKLLKSLGFLCIDTVDTYIYKSIKLLFIIFRYTAGTPAVGAAPWRVEVFKVFGCVYHVFSVSAPVFWYMPDNTGHNTGYNTGYNTTPTI